jgi:GNAT superfamily N-acetyltransferase
VGVVSGAPVIRTSRPGDDAALLAIWDRAIAWLVARGQAMQWGSEPASAQRRYRVFVARWMNGSGLRIAELDDAVVGASVITDAPPPHVPATPRRETYLLFLLSDRDHAGRGIGAALVRRAVAEARDAGSELLRVDCWAGAPDLVAWYERQGFRRSDTFVADVRGGWHGQVLEMVL